MKTPPAPSVELRSFVCPHCGAYANQRWFEVEATGIEGRPPLFPTEAQVQAMEAGAANIRDELRRYEHENLAHHMRRRWSGHVYRYPYNERVQWTVVNLFLSECEACDELSVWHRKALVYPPAHVAPPPNPDLPAPVLRDYNEASTILDLSPRGAAALLRLALEKLCDELKAEGSNVNEKIAHLVRNGLPTTIQQALDVVRVIGNHAVHPGQIDLRDDRGTALQLFHMVNLAADELISKHRKVAELYAIVPAGQKAAIDARDRPKPAATE